MIISKDVNPLRDFYYLGAKIIEVIENTKAEEHDFFSIYEVLKSKEEISFSLYTLTLDWLYIIGAIDKPKNGKVVKCF